MTYKPNYDLSAYRKFIREAAPFVSLVIGRKIKPAEGDLLSDAALLEIAQKIDERAKDLNVQIAANKKNGFPFPKKDN